MCRKTTSLLLCFLLTILLLQSTAALSQEQSGPKGSQPPVSSTFGYDEESGNGPSNWGNLNPNWTLCSNGKQQSPININAQNLRLDLSAGSFTVWPYASQAIARNRGYDTQVQWPNGSAQITVGGETFLLRSLHWHFPSEHTVYGIRFRLEMHMVLQNSDNQVAVIGIVFISGNPDPFLSPKLMQQLSQLMNSQSDVNVGLLMPPIIKSGTPYYMYSGSLTTPPCTEGVNFIILQEIRTVSREQLDFLRSLAQWNNTARPVQGLNGRIVTLYKQLF